MDFEALTQWCKNCNSWYDKNDYKLSRALCENGKEIIFCAECSTELMDSAEWSIQTPYQREVCKLLKEEIRNHQIRINTLEDRIKSLLGEV